MSTWVWSRKRCTWQGTHLTPKPMLTERCPGPEVPVTQIKGDSIQVKEGGIETPGSHMVPIPKKGAFRKTLVTKAVRAHFHLCTEPTSSTPFPDIALGVIGQPGCEICKSFRQGPWV